VTLVAGPGGAEVVVAPGPDGRPRYRVLRQGPLLALRPTPAGLHLVSPAATPLGGDEVTLRLAVEAGARLVVRSAAASVARRGPRGAPSRLEVRATVEEEAWLCWLVEPTVVADGATHDAVSFLELAEGAGLWWREVTILGRSGESGGRGRSRLAVDRAGWPVVRHELRFAADDPALGGPAGLGGARVVGTALATVLARSPVPGPLTQASGSRVVVLPTVDPGLVLVQGLAEGWRQLEEAWGPALAWVASVHRCGEVPW
jgi:urease accessory protein